MTVHDISHLDALWDTTSSVAEGAVNVNPAEAFVLGASILLHDAAMSLAAYPGGVAEVRTTIAWKDAVARLALASDEGAGESFDIENPPNGIVQRIVPDVLRRLHAERAEELAEQAWPAADGAQVYLIEDMSTSRVRSRAALPHLGIKCPMLGRFVPHIGRRGPKVANQEHAHSSSAVPYCRPRTGPDNRRCRVDPLASAHMVEGIPELRLHSHACTLGGRGDIAGLFAAAYLAGHTIGSECPAARALGQMRTLATPIPRQASPEVFPPALS
jgi:hypothetical protein